MLPIYEVSCRKNDGWLGDLSVGQLRFFDANSKAITAQDFSDAITGKRIFNFAHGYHTKEAAADDAIRYVAGMVDAKVPAYQAGVLFSWSGGLTYAGFGLAVARTSKCGERYAELLEIENAAGAQIDCASHSLGAGVTAEALILPRSAMVRNWIALAAAIPDDSLSAGGKYVKALDRLGRVLAPYSDRDQALATAYRLGSFGKTALGHSGPRGTTSTNVVPVNAHKYVGSHSDAYRQPDVYDLWQNFLLRMI